MIYIPIQAHRHSETRINEPLSIVRIILLLLAITTFHYKTGFFLFYSRRSGLFSIFTLSPHSYLYLVVVLKNSILNGLSACMSSCSILIANAVRNTAKWIESWFKRFFYFFIKWWNWNKENRIYWVWGCLSSTFYSILFSYIFLFFFCLNKDCGNLENDTFTPHTQSHHDHEIEWIKIE